jgi:2-oxoglutarate ferredoxin oxidoreductase subunit alpha
MMEAVDLPPFKKRTEPLDWGIDGTGTKGLKYVPGAGPHIAKLNVDKYSKVEAEMQRWESLYIEDAEYIFVAFGIPSRVCKDALEKLRAQGEKVGMIRPQIIWPYPWKAFEEVKQKNPNVKGFISVETNDLGQMVEDVALATKRYGLNVPVYCYAHGPGTPGVHRVMDVYQNVKSGKEKERF